VYKYEDYKTPYEAFKKLSNYDQYLKAGVSIERMDSEIRKMSPTMFAKKMQEARTKLFKQITIPDPTEIDLLEFVKARSGSFPN